MKLDDVVKHVAALGNGHLLKCPCSSCVDANEDECDAEIAVGYIVQRAFEAVGVKVAENGDVVVPTVRQPSAPPKGNFRMRARK